MTKSEFDPVFKTLCDNLEGTPRQLSRQQKREKYKLFYQRFIKTDAQVFFDATNAWISKSDFMPTALQMQDAVDYQESANKGYVPIPTPKPSLNEDGSRKSFRDIIRTCGNPKAITAYNKFCCKGKHKPIEAEEVK